MNDPFKMFRPWFIVLNAAIFLGIGTALTYAAFAVDERELSSTIDFWLNCAAGVLFLFGLTTLAAMRFPVIRQSLIRANISSTRANSALAGATFLNLGLPLVYVCFNGFLIK